MTWITHVELIDCLGSSVWLENSHCYPGKTAVCTLRKVRLQKEVRWKFPKYRWPVWIKTGFLYLIARPGELGRPSTDSVWAHLDRWTDGGWRDPPWTGVLPAHSLDFHFLLAAEYEGCSGYWWGRIFPSALWLTHYGPHFSSPGWGMILLSFDATGGKGNHQNQLIFYPLMISCIKYLDAP